MSPLEIAVRVIIGLTIIAFVWVGTAYTATRTALVVLAALLLAYLLGDALFTIFDATRFLSTH